MPNKAHIPREVAEREQRFWTEGGGNPGFWSRHFADDGLVALPIGIMDKAQVVAAMQQAEPWAQATLEDVRSLEVADGVAALSYRATARRAGEQADYTAVVSSVYARRDGDWFLVFHQQTPTAPS
jgi:Domain of unknown function (DUF4440)